MSIRRVPPGASCGSARMGSRPAVNTVLPAGDRWRPAGCSGSRLEEQCWRRAILLASNLAGSLGVRLGISFGGTVDGLLDDGAGDVDLPLTGPKPAQCV